MKTLKYYCKPFILTVQADSLMANGSGESTTGNIPISGTSDKKRFVSGRNPGSSWTWTEDEGDDDSWTNQ